MRFHLTFRYVRWCLCAISFALSCIAQEPKANSAATAVVHIRVNTEYNDSEESLRLLETIALYAPVRRIPVVPGDTVAALLVREYGFGPSDLPKSFALLMKFTLEKNHLERAEDLRPGTLIIPSVPRRVWMGFGRNNPLNFMANMTVFRSDTATTASSSANRLPTSTGSSIIESEPPEVAYTRSEPVDAHRLTAPYELLDVELPLKAAASLLQSPAFAKGTVTGFTYPMPVRLAADNACDTEPASKDHQTLTAEQKSRVSQLLKQQSQRAPVVFILDTGWPNWPAYLESREALYDVLDNVWRGKFGIPFPKPAAQKSILPATHQHCRCIERALKELRALEENVSPDKKIRIIYVPLTREQGATTILSDLLQTSELLQRNIAGKNVTLNAAIINGSRKYASDLVKRSFPASWSGEEVNTDKSVMDAVLLIGQVYSERANTVFFANESWTVRHGEQYYVQYQTPQYGIVTSAAGNDGTTNLLDFAQRSASTRDTMAIINMTGNGVASQSTRIEERDLDNAIAAGFDGVVTDDISGTSFSSPRIAWFLAAGEAVRSKPLEQARWGIQLWQQLKAIRDQQATGYQKLLFDPVKYIGAQIAAGTK
jgi:hypothetical protein